MQYDKHLSKKLQGQLKSNVISFCKVIISWKSDVEEIEKLLIALQALHKSLDAINKSLQTPNHSFLTARFPDLNGILVSKLLADAEAINVQLRTFWKRVSDVEVAIQKLSCDTMKLVVGQAPIVVFGDEDMFTADHALECQELACQYSLEYNRKSDLLQKLLSVDNDEEMNNIVEEVELSKLLSQVVQVWADDHANSFLNNSSIDLFLQLNGGHLS